MARILVVGSSNIDLTVALPAFPRAGETVLGGHLLKGFGGKGGNQAVAASKAGASVAFFSAVGDDDHGIQMLDHYRAEGLDLGHIKVVEGVPTGAALILVNDHAENMIGVGSGANSRLTSRDIVRLPGSLFEPDGWLLIAGLEIPMEPIERAIDRAHQAGMNILLNPAPMPSNLASCPLLKQVNLITPNRIELEGITGKPAHSKDDVISAGRALQDLGPRQVLVTLGADGALILDGKSPPKWVTAQRVKAIDTVGAGDAFSGALAAALSEGKGLIEAADWASAAAAISVTRRGAQSASANHLEIEAMLADG